ncbi:MAG: ATP-binding cassette domain-containing protein [Tenericutes bacterium]|nr:ATP-binding cassette domain-containing protein [Mycoplasmatota bacterium]
MQSLLQIKNLSKNYITKNKVTKAVDNISLDINDNEFITLIGPSGCGKSTILSIIGNLDEKSSGIIKFKNKDIKVGYMFQEDLLFPWLTVYENTVLGLKIKKELNEENKKYVNDLLEKYGLIEFKNNYPKELSGGMRQRVACI